MLETIFGHTHQVSALQECARAILVFAVGLALVRIAGRRVFGQWSALDIIVSIVIGSNLSRAITGTAPLIGTIAASVTLMVVHYLLSVAAARWRPLSRLIEGAPIHLGRDGEWIDRRHVLHGISLADVHEALRGAGVEDVRDTRLVTLEPSGKITVLR